MAEACPKVNELCLASLPCKGPAHHVVYIWMSVGTHQFGHASLLLSNGVYISWWPKGVKAKCGPLRKHGNCCSSLREDVESETFEPDYVFRIPSEKVSTDKMTTYWESWLTRGHYTLLNRNCCSMVYRVLMKGGAPRSATLIWRPETLRRYLVIYLGGGSRSQLVWNWPRSDEQYKGSHTLYTWNPDSRQDGHVSLLLDNNVYISWNPFLLSSKDDDLKDWVLINHGTQTTSKEDDVVRIGRLEDKTLTFRPKYLDLCEMKRRWKAFSVDEAKELWGANSFWLTYQIFTAGNAPKLYRSFDYWCAKTLEEYVFSNFEVECLMRR